MCATFQLQELELKWHPGTSKIRRKIWKPFFKRWTSSINKWKVIQFWGWNSSKREFIKLLFTDLTLSTDYLGMRKNREKPHTNKTLIIVVGRQACEKLSKMLCEAVLALNAPRRKDRIPVAVEPGRSQGREWRITSPRTKTAVQSHHSWRQDAAVELVTERKGVYKKGKESGSAQHVPI